LKRFGTAAILCGGKSRRMGFDKSEIMIDGKLLIEYIAERLEELFDEILLVTDDIRKYEHLKYTICEDIYRERGPIGGIHAALTCASSNYVFITACDMPVINTDYIRYMMDLIEKTNAEGVAAWKNGYVETLYAFYSKDMSDRIDFLISQENCKLLQLLECSRVQLVEEEDVNNLTAGLDVFVNLNKKTDLALLNKIFGGITISWRARRL